jgi:hypothetical protein
MSSIAAIMPLTIRYIHVQNIGKLLGQQEIQMKKNKDNRRKKHRN